jgi:FKBP-type peptidyl-prolyl cis-trans isomerase
MYRVIAVSVGLALLVGCASSTSDQPVQDPTSATTSLAAGSGGSPATSPAAPKAVAPGAVTTAVPGAADAPGLPAVTGAGDLTKAPVIAAGTGAPTAVTVRDLVVGSGAAVPATATVTLKYVGSLFTTGTVFDSSWGHGDGTARFALTGVIAGFAQGLIGMKMGGRREIVIPPEFGYGAAGTGPIPGNSTLVFVVDMVSSTG